MARAGLVLVALLALSGCAAINPACPAGTQPALVAQLLMGRDIPGGGQVSDSDWRAFLDEEATPRFPDGLTVADAAGQWKDSDTGATVREPSKILTLVITDPDRTEPLKRLGAVAEAYKARFRQQSVGTLLTAACGSF